MIVYWRSAIAELLAGALLPLLLLYALRSDEDGDYQTVIPRLAGDRGDGLADEHPRRRDGELFSLR